MDFNFSKAKREKAKARICLCGASGGGKTLSSLYLAYGMTNDWGKIAVVDSERGRALMYANRSDLGTGEFLHCDLEPPYTVESYVEAMKEACDILSNLERLKEKMTHEEQKAISSKKSKVSGVAL